MHAPNVPRPSIPLCPLWVVSRSADDPAPMSAVGRKADSNVGLAGESARRSGAVIESGYSQERPLADVVNPWARIP